MADEIYGQDYVGEERAWHSKGVTLGRQFTAIEAIEHANLDYEVQMLPLYTFDAAAPYDGQAVGRCATIRADLEIGNPDRILGIVGPMYTIVQNRNAFSFFDEIVEQDLAIYVSAGVLGHGEKIFLVAKLPMEYWVAKDRFETFVTLVSGHDGMHALKVFATSVRVVCQNTLNMALKQTALSVSLRHTRNIHDRLLEAPAILGLVDSKFRETQNLFQVLASRPITVPLFNQYVEELFPSENPNARTLAHREAITLLLDDPLNTTQGIRHTWYSASQGVIQYVDHMMPLRKGKDRFEGKMFGSGANLKKRAMDLAEMYAFMEDVG
jgi:phage/plasmid-like protein (TIGR03299 family)